MMRLYTTVELADMCKSLTGKDSYNSVGKLLDVSATTVKLWYVAAAIMDDNTGMKAAKALNLSPAAVLLSLQIERASRANNDKLTHTWRKIAEQIAA